VSVIDPTEAKWLPAAFFDAWHSEHAKWSLTTFLAWISHTKPHIHKESGTVYGGPLGVRLLLFGISIIAQNLMWLKEGDRPPRDILKVTRGKNNGWSLTLNEHTLASCISILCENLDQSHERLTHTYEERCNAWEQAILNRKNDIEEHLRVNKPDCMEEGPTATSGIPNGYRLQNEMLYILESRRALLSETTGEVQSSPATHSLGPSTMQPHHDGDASGSALRAGTPDWGTGELTVVLPGNCEFPTGHQGMARA
jgi:hypothetical protein